VVDITQQSTGRWLDVGFGNGALMTVAEEYGFDVIGLEAREDVVEAMRRHGYEVHRGDLTDYVGEPLDVISLADVLEHLAFPKVALRRAHELLKPEGLLFVSMPNIDSYVWRCLDEEGTNPYWGELEHLHNFSRERLYALLNAHGFEPIRYGISERYVICMEVIARRR
jgi:2-polyprenyl-3-methyl-5-hydroxy-6-metoxy-1,4-benzoquinol methylase